MNTTRPRKSVAIIVDAASHYGRAVARGAMHYANQRRQWSINADFRQSDTLLQCWPHCEGAIIAGVSADTFDLIVKTIPHVVSCASGSGPASVPVVSTHSAACGTLAAEHLVGCRVRHFAYCGWAGLPASELRRQGFCQALEARGLTCSIFTPTATTPNPSIAAQHRAETLAWLHAQPKPLGLLAYDDWVAYDLAAICQSEGILVPQQVAILGVNDDDLLCPTAWPPLSSVRIDFHQVGFFAARQLDRLLSGETLGPEERLLRILPAGVVRRQSTDLLAVHDRHVAAAVRFIRRHACDPCTIDQILHHVPVGRRWLERKFVEVLNRTLYEELQHARLEAAQRLLLESDEKIERVAEACGFSNARTFIRAFDRTLGTTPAAFRRAHFTATMHRPT